MIFLGNNIGYYNSNTDRLATASNQNIITRSLNVGQNENSIISELTVL